jgi:hypothetical protein
LPRHRVPKLGGESRAVLFEGLEQELKGPPPNFNVVALHCDFLESKQDRKPEFDQEILARLDGLANCGVGIVDNNRLTVVSKLKHSWYRRFDHVESWQTDFLELAVLGEFT